MDLAIIKSNLSQQISLNTYTILLRSNYDIVISFRSRWRD